MIEVAEVAEFLSLCAAAWGVLGGIARWAYYENGMITNESGAGDTLMALGPVTGPAFLTYYLLWRLSAKGRHEARMNKRKRRREIEKDLDEEIERLEVEE